MNSRPLRFDQDVAHLWLTMSPTDIAETVGCCVAAGDRWSVRPQKTYDLSPLTVDDHQLRLAYLAGHLDGDGFIGHHEMKGVIGDLGIRRKWAALDTTRAALAARQTKEAA